MSLKFQDKRQQQRRTIELRDLRAGEMFEFVSEEGEGYGPYRMLHQNSNYLVKPHHLAENLFVYRMDTGKLHCNCGHARVRRLLCTLVTEERNG